MNKRNELMKLAAAKIIVNNTRPQMRATNEVVKLAAAKILRQRFPELKKIAQIPGVINSTMGWLNQSPDFISNTSRNYLQNQINGPSMSNYWAGQLGGVAPATAQMDDGFEPILADAALRGRMTPAEELATMGPGLSATINTGTNTAVANASRGPRIRDWFFGTRGKPSLSEVASSSPRLQSIRGALSSAKPGVAATALSAKNMATSPFAKTMGALALASALVPLLQGKGAFGIRALGGKSREDEAYDRQMQMYERAIRMAQLGQMAQGMGGFNNAMSPIYGLSSVANPYFNYTPGARQVR